MSTYKVFLIILGYCALVKPSPAGFLSYYGSSGKGHLEEVPHYSYEYNVHDPHTGDEKSHRESRHGDVVKGFYTLKEADGTTREVHYTADNHNGFNAQVKKIGYPIPQPIYHNGFPNNY